MNNCTFVGSIVNEPKVTEKAGRYTIKLTLGTETGWDKDTKARKSVLVPILIYGATEHTIKGYKEGSVLVIPNAVVSAIPNEKNTQYWNYTISCWASDIKIFTKGAVEVTETKVTTTQPAKTDAPPF